jgi:hypothetical protein
MARLQVVWWNVQRLFRPEPSRLSRELDATPANGWNAASYRRKIENVAAVLRALRRPDAELALIALCEVQDGRVLADILRAAGLRHFAEAESAGIDLDGHDVVVAYSREHFALDGEPTAHNLHGRYATRDILEVPLRTLSGERLLLLANHWPSRRFANAEILRFGLADFCFRLALRRLKLAKAELVDARGRLRLAPRAALERAWNERILVLGDFNDAPFDDSVAVGLAGTRAREIAGRVPRLPVDRGRSGVTSYLRLQPRLFNPSWALLDDVGSTPPGTVFWNGEWYLLDQVLLSSGLLASAGLRWVEGSLGVFAASAVSAGERAVRVRTRAGYPRPFDPADGEGVSDHLPLSLELTV